MSKCVNQSHLDFIELINKTGVNRAILAAQVSLWMDRNNTNSIPSMKDLDLNYTLKTAPDLYKKYNLINNNGTLKELSFDVANKWLATNKNSPNYNFKLNKLPSGKYTLLIQDKESNLNKKQENTIAEKITPVQGKLFQDEAQQKSKEITSEFIADEFKSKELPNERKFNRPTNLPEGFRLVQGSFNRSTGQFSSLSSVGINELANSKSTIKRSTGRENDNSVRLPYFYGVLGRNFKEILSNKKGDEQSNLDTKIRYANLRFIQAINNNNLLRGMVSRLGISEIRVINSSDIANPVFTYKNYLYINEEKWLKRIENAFDNGINLDEYIDIAAFEELIHIAAEKIAGKQVIKESLEELSDSDKLIVDNFYLDNNSQQLFKSNLSSYQTINELIRMKVQKDLIGTSTEDLSNTSFTKNSFIDNIVNKIWDFIMSLFKDKLVKSNKIAEDVKDFIKGKDFKFVDNSNNELAGLAPIENKQDKIVNALKSTASQIEKKDDGYYFNGKKVPKRVTEIVKDWYAKKFQDKALTKSEYQKAVDDLKAENGTKGHADIEHAFSLFIDENGNVREIPLDDSDYVSKLNPENRDAYELLRDNLKERIESINSKAPGTKFFAEVMVYNPKVYGGLGGTIDFLSVSPEGKVNIYDWKFMNINENKYEDVPWYKVNAWKNQMDQYKLILQNAYGVKSEDFEQTRMIPIQTIYTEGNVKNNVLPQLKSIRIGDVNVQNIKQDFLLPVGIESESTGNPKIDKLLEKLNGEYKKLSEKKITENEKASKAEALNQLFHAIRQLQIKGNLAPIIRQAKLVNKQIELTLKKFDNWKDVNPLTVKENEINDFAEEIRVAEEIVDVYTRLDLELKELFTGKDSEEDEKLYQDLKNTANTAREYEAELQEKLDWFGENIIAKSEKVNKLLTPEKVIKGITKWFGTTSTLQIKSIEVLYKKASRAFDYAAKDTNTEIRRLTEIKEQYDKWAKNKGLNVKNYFNSIKKETSNELIDEYNPTFYKMLKDKIEEKDFKWIRENVDVEAYKEKIKELLTQELERIENKTRVGTDEEINQELTREKLNAKALFNVSTPTSPGWLLYDKINKFPLDKWFTKEWIELNAKDSNGNYINEPALNFYKYIREKNAEYKELGYIGRGKDRTFLPFVRKGLVEKLIFGGKISIGEQFLRSISVDEGDTGLGKIDPLTGKPVDSIPKYFTSEIEGEVSTDLFKTMFLYNEMALKYKYVSQIEESVQALLRIERNKKAIRTSIFNKAEKKNGQFQYSNDNTANAQLLEDSIKSIIYGQKFIQSETFDQVLGKIGNWGEKLNDKLGLKGSARIFPENLSGRQISVNKVIDAFNNQFQLNTLAINPLSATSNFFGGNAQSIINAGKWFTKTDYTASEFELFTNKLTNNENRKKILAALEYFLPLTENYNQELAKKLSLKNISQENIQDALMILMRQTDLHVQTVNFMSFLKNSVVINDEVVNAREYLRKQEKYANINLGTKEERERLKEEFEKDVKELVKEKGVLQLSTIKNGELVIPGVERKSRSVVELKRKVQSLTANALGQLSEADKRKINMTVAGKSFMIFKNWIPSLMSVRFGELAYDSKSDAYEWGRMRTLMRYLADDTLGAINNLLGTITGTGKGSEQYINYIRELYEKKKNDYEQETGKELEMTESEFIDLVRNNIRNQMYDLMFLLTLVSLVALLKAAAPDDEDEAVRNQYKFLVKAADKLRDEISYFYDPTSFSSMFSTGLFPSISLLNNFKKVFTNFLKENYYILTDNEKEEEKNFVIKYAMRSFPFTNQVVGYLPMLYPELAKDLGLRMQSNYGLR